MQRRRNMRPEGCRSCDSRVEVNAGYLYRDNKPNRFTGRFGWFVKCEKCHVEGETRHTLSASRGAAKKDAVIESMGGKFSIGELREATVKVVELPRQYVGITDPHYVWEIRGSEWLVAYDFGGEPLGMMLLAERHNSRFAIVPFKSATAKRFAVSKVQAMVAESESACADNP